MTTGTAATDSVDRAALPVVDSRDYPIVEAAILCLSAMYIGVNLLVDVLYAYLNPKIRYSR